jgi:hypothetical protein
MSNGILWSDRHQKHKGAIMSVKASNFHSRKFIHRAIGLAFALSLALPNASAKAGDLKSRGATTQPGFKSNCGGTLSEKLPFGGKTCTTPGGW